MLLVKTRVGLSGTHGLGLFAEEFIPKGKIIWEFHPGFDLVIEEDRINELPEVPREWMKHHAHISRKNKKYTLSIDNDVYINHSDNPNTTDVDTGKLELSTVALRDIHAGEEITCNYLNYALPSDMTAFS